MEPRNVRNFWVEGMVDGRGPIQGFGPKGAGDGFSLTIYVRDHGTVGEPVKVRGWAGNAGKLHISIERLGQQLACVDSER